MPDIRAGAKIQAADFPASVTATDSTSLTSISSTSYSAGSPVVSVTFVAPTSGRVLLTVGLGARNSGSSDRVHLAPEVRVGSSGGSVFLAADVAMRGVGSSAGGSAYHYRARTTLLDGLTPGQTYYARTMHKVSSGNGDINARDITVVPAS